MFSAPALRPRLPYKVPSTSWLRRIMPRSLFGRALLIVMLPLLIAQGVLAYIFYERHWDNVTRWFAVGLAGEVAILLDLLDSARTPEQRNAVLELARKNFDFAVSLEPNGRLETAVADHLHPQTWLDEIIAHQIGRQLERPFAVDTRGTQRPSRIAIYVQLDSGLLRVLAPRKRVDSATTRVFIGWMVGLSLLLLALAIFFLTRQLRPIRRLAWAADNFGKGRDVGDFRLEGATEIRQAGAAFNLMRKRILRHIAQRTEMLAAVSHDLRTPLTRMKLELEMLAGQANASSLDDLRGDVEEMVNVVDGYLAFARGEGEERIETTDLGELLEEVAERSSKDAVAIEVELESPIVLPLRPTAFRRCITNLVENAVRHASHIHIRATCHHNHVWIAIDDDGPGITEDQREAVFKAFHRVEGSRNPSTGGVGLGLTIARDIVLAHGGEVELHDAPSGGLRVLIRLPR